MKTYTAEAFGTFWLVLGGCGSAVLAAAYPSLGIGFLGVSIAFGLTLLTIGVAVFAGGWALEQLWLFWVAPIVGGVLGAYLYKFVAGRTST